MAGTNVNDITSAEWSISIKGQGEVEQGFNDINQCIQIIVSTQKGTDPLRPSFGCDMWRFMDYGINEAAPLMVREILDAVATWETRIEITDVVYALQKDAVEFTIKWILQDNRQRGAASITLDFAPTRQIDAEPVVIPPLQTPTLSATYSYPDVNLLWNFDAPIGVTFQILRSVNGGIYAQIGQVSSVTTFTDADAPKDSTLTYIVRAIKGSRASDFSTPKSVNTIEAILAFNSSDDSYIDLIGVSEVVETIGGLTKVYLPTDSIGAVTAFYSDDAGDPDLNAGISTDLNLDDRFTGLRDVRARNQSFGFVTGTWVKNANVSINVENSVITASRVTTIIDSVIVSNGGTTTDDGTNYTGTPGETHADRVLNIGTIELDLTDPTNSVLFQKITALEGVGWTITTVTTLCLKRLIVSTDFTEIGGFIEKTRSLEGLEFVSGSPLVVKLYETEAQAQAGGATGLLADGYAAVDAWLRDDANYNAWIAGNPKGLRFETTRVTTGNLSRLSYKAAPTAERVCGDNDFRVDYFAGNAKVYDGTFDYDIVQSVDFLDFDTPIGFCCAFELERNNVLQYLLQFGRNVTSLSQGFARITPLSDATFQILITSAGSNARIIYQSSELLIVGKNIIALSYDGSGTAAGLRVYVNGVLDVPTSSTTVGTLTTIKPYQGADVLSIGANATSTGANSYTQGYIKRFEFLNVEPSDADLQAACNATTGGSFKAAGYSPADFFLEMDFNRVDGQTPIELADGRTVNSFGGPTYVDYPSL